MHWMALTEQDVVCKDLNGETGVRGTESTVQLRTHET